MDEYIINAAQEVADSVSELNQNGMPQAYALHMVDLAYKKLIAEHLEDIVALLKRKEQ